MDKPERWFQLWNFPRGRYNIVLETVKSVLLAMKKKNSAIYPYFKPFFCHPLCAIKFADTHVLENLARKELKTQGAECQGPGKIHGTCNDIQVKNQTMVDMTAEHPINSPIPHNLHYIPHRYSVTQFIQV